tara:strand:- start:132 stop:440 length:309 start_codon:yes stop_codon:yes gene_type:complete
MSKLILSIKTRNKSFNLLEKVYKDFGVVFHPNIPVTEVNNFIGEAYNGKSITEASGEVRQGNSKRTRLVGKAKEVEEQKETNGLENPRDKIPSSHSLKREDK